MLGVTITGYDDQNILIVSLTELLNVIGPQAEKALWRIKEVESIGELAQELYNIEDSGRLIDGKLLSSIAANVSQIIDGVFTAYKDGEDFPWLIIRAVDSSAFDVECSEEEVLSKIREHFVLVADFPQD